MTGRITYRMPDGAEIVSESGSTVTFSVTNPRRRRRLLRAPVPELQAHLPDARR